MGIWDGKMISLLLIIIGIVVGVSFAKKISGWTGGI